MKNPIIYQDGFIEISKDSLILKKYYYPSLKAKEIKLSNIEKIEVKEPSIWTGKWRFHGTGNFKTWFPLDVERNKRDKIFFSDIKKLMGSNWVHRGKL